MQEGIEVVRVRAVEPIQEHPGITTGWGGKDLQARLRPTIAANFTAHNKNGPVRHDQRSGIPSLALGKRCADELAVALFSWEMSHLQLEFLEVLLPIVCAVDTRGTVRPIKPNAPGTVITPATNVQLTSTAIG